MHLPKTYRPGFRRLRRAGCASLLALALASAALHAAAATRLELLLPLKRTVYQTNEQIDLAVLRVASDAALAADVLQLEAVGDNGSRLTFTFPLAAVPPDAKGEARATERLHLDAALLRPGTYVLEARAQGAAATNRIELYSHIRKTPFRLIDWGGSGTGKGEDQVRCGEQGSGFNLMMGSYAGHNQEANIRGGIDYMRNCTMAGAHQMDGRLECDWSDPYVLEGGNARSARQALKDRVCGNVIGVHFYDEPGLTWQPHPKTGVFSPHNIPSQDWAFQAAFGTPALQYNEVNPADPASYSAWEQFLRWKQVFMESAWRGADFSVRHVNSRWLTATQSMYGWLAFGDGYYFNIVRPLSVMSGHGGYDDYAGGYLAPGFFFEMGRMRDYEKPVWYLPGWWENSPSEIFRLEQYLTFMMGAQGVAVPPGVRTEQPGTLLQDEAVLESNRTMARLGPIFTAMPVTRPPVAMLYSMSQNAKAMMASKDFANGQDFAGQVERLFQLYVAAKMSHIPVFPIVEEDILDGTLAANHTALLVTGLDVLEPRVVASLEAWIAAGGKVIMSDECTVAVAGATKLGAAVTDKIYIAAGKEFGSGEQGTRQMRGCSTRSALAYFREGAPIAKALTARLKEAGIGPAAEVSEPQVFVSRHAQADVEYLFLANATTDEDLVLKLKGWNSLKAAQSDVAVPDDGRPLYDLLDSTEAAGFSKKRGTLTANLRFGPGQFRAFARTTRPVAGVQVVSARMDPAAYTRTGRQNTLCIEAAVVDAAGKALAGALPLAVQVIDPLGVMRYDLFRATDGSQLRLELPLGVNEAVGTWTVRVRELLSGKEGAGTFAYRAPAQCGALAGRTWRASYFHQDYDNIFRFFRLHRNLALVTGSSDYTTAQAQRLAENLKRWGITATIVPAADIKKKDRPKEVFKTWVGAYDHPDFDMPADGAVLLGSLEDNPVIRALNAGNFQTLPYVPVKDIFPGRGRGLVAWQIDAVAFHNYETVTAIAHDAEGLAEAVGTLFEIASGYQPATAWDLPAKAAVAPALLAPGLAPQAKVAWVARLPDRAVTVTVDGNAIEILSLDGSVTRLAADGKVLSQKGGQEAKAHQAFREVVKPRPEPALDAACRDATKVAKFMVQAGDLTAVGFWGGQVRLFDAAKKLLTSQMLPQDIAGLVWCDGRLVAALADGQVMALTVK